MPATLAPQQVADFQAQQPLDLLLEAQRLSKNVAAQIAQSFKPGMSETEAQQVAVQIFQSHSVISSWHKPYIRFGQHTMLTFFDAPPKEDICLQENDIAFLDIGPVFKLKDENGQNHLIEGDFGTNVIIGQAPEQQAIVDACKRLFDAGKHYWQEQKPTGKALYAFLHQEAEKAGYRFQLPEAGHLLGPYSHSKNGFSGYLSQYEGIVESGCWILEVQLANKGQTFGAFYEDLLI